MSTSPLEEVDRVGFVKYYVLLEIITTCVAPIGM